MLTDTPPDVLRDACPRCGEGPTFTWIGSWFQPLDVCLSCRDDERFAPHYLDARQACARADAEDAIFSGLGFQPDDLAVLAARRQARGSST